MAHKKRERDLNNIQKIIIFFVQFAQKPIRGTEIPRINNPRVIEIDVFLTKSPEAISNNE